MTIDEASTCYNIPLDILREYESWGLCDAVKKVMGSKSDRRRYIPSCTGRALYG